MTKHFQIDCGRQVGYPFVQAFLFTPQGSTLYVGDLGSIREKTKDLPTCHGVVLFWQFKAVSYKIINLFGKNTSYPGFTLYHGNNAKGGKYAISEAVRMFASRRPQYILVYGDGSKYELVNRWRRMPSCYLGDMFEKYLKDRERRRVTTVTEKFQVTTQELARATKKTFTLPKVKEEADEMMEQWVKASQQVMPWLTKEAMAKMMGFNNTMLNKMLEGEEDGNS